MAQYLPLVFKDNAHRPLDPSVDKLPGNVLALSARSGNRLQALADGLYAGPVPGLTVVYVNSSGTDAAGNGAIGAPVKTLDYALAYAVTQFQFPGTSITIALQAGQTFALTGRYTIPEGCVLRLAFYGDTTFGSFNSALVSGVVRPALMATLARPVVQATFVQDSYGYYLSSGFVGGSLTLEGVNVTLAARPNPAPADTAYGNVDFYSSSNQNASAANLHLIGAVINKQDYTSYAGLMGIEPRTQVCNLNQFGSRFLIAGVAADGTTGLNASQLSMRQHFIHLYSDWGGADSRDVSLIASSATASNGSGMLNLSWSDTVGASVGAGTTQSTFPQLADVTYGIRNYFNGLRRDQQSRPLNVISGRLF